MADITMCANSNCKRKDECYRTRAVQSDWQSWSIFGDNKYGTDCDNFIQYYGDKEFKRDKQ